MTNILKPNIYPIDPKFVPLYAKSGDSGCDVFANIDEDVVLRHFDVVTIPVGIYLEIPLGFEAQVRPRSGLARTNKIFVLNSPGTIDSGYRKEVGVILANFNVFDDFIIHPMDRIAQLVFVPVMRAEFNIVSSLDQLSESDRLGGFGHTGV